MKDRCLKNDVTHLFFQSARAIKDQANEEVDTFYPHGYLSPKRDMKMNEKLYSCAAYPLKYDLSFL